MIVFIVFSVIAGGVVFLVRVKKMCVGFDNGATVARKGGGATVLT